MAAHVLILTDSVSRSLDFWSSSAASWSNFCCTRFWSSATLIVYLQSPIGVQHYSVYKSPHMTLFTPCARASTTDEGRGHVSQHDSRQTTLYLFPRLLFTPPGSPSAPGRPPLRCIQFILYVLGSGFPRTMSCISIVWQSLHMSTGVGDSTEDIGWMALLKHSHTWLHTQRDANRAQQGPAQDISGVEKQCNFPISLFGDICLLNGVTSSTTIASG